MSATVRYLLNRASEADIADHLRRCDNDFIPALSARVDLASYAGKIIHNATRIEAWQRSLVGLLAVYCNDPARRMAYVTTVSVLPEWRGRGIGSRLVDECVRLVRDEVFPCIELEVDARNAAAISLYAHKGFAALGPENEGPVLMRLSLHGQST